jgi:predicted methyltransferase
MRQRRPLTEAVYLSGPVARRLLAARASGQRRCLASPDLGKSTVEAELLPEGVAMPGKPVVPWPVVERIAGSDYGCFRIEAGQAWKIQAFSEIFQRPYSLWATEGAPTLLAAGFPMHRFKGIDPWEDARLKVRAVAPICGVVLDTCTGLGYTAILATERAQRVVTVELDAVVLEIARQNPWSWPLFTLANIEQQVGDVAELIQRFEAHTFDVILHDPPTVELAGELYGLDFYRELFRVLKPTGRLYHYTGDPASAHGRRVRKGVIQRLKEAGFRRVQDAFDAHGVRAIP